MLNFTAPRTLLAKHSVFVIFLFACAGSVPAQARFTTSSNGLPEWVKHVGGQFFRRDKR